MEKLLQLHNLVLAICRDKYAVPEMMAERITKEVDNYVALFSDEEAIREQERERIIKMFDNALNRGKSRYGVIKFFINEEDWQALKENKR